MHFTKTFSAVKSFHLHRCRKTLSLFQNGLIKQISSSANKSDPDEVGEAAQASLAEEKTNLKGPFVKNLFAGIYDESILEYPEYPSMEYISELKSITNPVEEFFQNCVDSKAIDEEKFIPKEVIDHLKEHKLSALTVPEKYGGLEFDDRCYARYCEAVGSDMSISTLLAAHYRSLNAILLHGSEEIKNKYLGKSNSGEFTFSFCLLEKPSMFDPSDVKTLALPNDNGDWVINGKKMWVTNGIKANTYIVFAKTWDGAVGGDQSTLLSAFLVDRNSPGIHCGPPLDQLGTRGIEICDVSFDNVLVKKENVLGEIGHGAEIAFQSLSRGRLGAAASAVGFLKNLLNIVTDFAAHTKISGKPLTTYEYGKRNLGLIAADIYALESMVYLTAGIKDTFNNPDLCIEESIVRVFSMEKIVEIVDICANLVGGYAYIKGSPLENFIRDSRSYLLHDVVPIDVTKIFISTLGLQHAGVTLRDDIKKSRNPWDFPSFVLKSAWKERNAHKLDAKIQQLLRLQLHPSLSGEADKLETCVVRFEAVVKNLLRRWGIEIVDRQMDLIRLADCAVSLYAMSAVIGRASRSYCIGLRNSDVDIATANVFCTVHSQKTNDTINRLFEGPMETNDTGYLLIGKNVASKNGYFYEHPLERNY